jgi:hypothetical protein
MLSVQSKSRVLKAESKKQQVAYKGKPIRIMVDFLAEAKKNKGIE